MKVSSLLKHKPLVNLKFSKNLYPKTWSTCLYSQTALQDSPLAWIWWAGSEICDDKPQSLKPFWCLLGAWKGYEKDPLSASPFIWTLRASGGLFEVRYQSAMLLARVLSHQLFLGHSMRATSWDEPLLYAWKVEIEITELFSNNHESCSRSTWKLMWNTFYEQILNNLNVTLSMWASKLDLFVSFFLSDAWHLANVVDWPSITFSSFFSKNVKTKTSSTFFQKFSFCDEN